MIIAHLSDRHNRKIFDCGVDDMNRYLKEQARQDAAKGLSRTFVNLDDDHTTIIGFYTLVMNELSFENIPNEKRLSRYPAPVVLLAQLAVDKAFQGRRIGEHLLYDAQARVIEIAENVGVYAMTLDAREPSLCAYYAQHRFKMRVDGPLRMYKTVTAIRQIGLTAAPLHNS
jgi:GNAT superfamily N-acetyltransferase